MISTAELRTQFLEFFRARGHEVLPSSPLVPAQDPTLLFTNAGMVQFKDVFLGTEKRDYNRAVTAQRCVRAGGKHNDLENVGYTARHHTFFEMLGNFSFGDYFKEDAIRFAWDFLTDSLGLPVDKLWVTVYVDDDEAADIWLKQIGVAPQRFTRIAGSDNFWQMGDTGPCGPCTEIFYDHGPEVAGGPPGTPEEDGDRYIEIWNLVFMQFDRAADGSMKPLPKPCVDTGMGLERLAAVMQGVHSNYEIDLFQNLLRAVAATAGVSDTANSSLRVIADHIRSCAFLITDGVLPSNDGRGYVLRRIIRRAARHGHSLGLSQPFFHSLVAPLVEQMGAAYPELAAARAQIERVLRVEEERFIETLGQGLKILEECLPTIDGRQIPGDVVFRLYDTFGFPYDLTADFARERGYTLDQAGFDAAMAAQRQRARAASQFGVDLSNRPQIDLHSEFVGYETLQGRDAVLGLYVDGQPVETLDAGQQALVVLARTPFYAESGGQVGDQGVLSTATARFKVEDTQKQGAAITHIGRLESGQMRLGDAVEASVDGARRQATVLNHSATHLMHAALREVLGDHVQQKGSLVGPDYLRFDFSHFEPVSSAQLRDIEQRVNQQIRANAEARAREMAMADAVNTGAMALFGEKYGDLVRVLSIGDYSIELCGGTHVRRAGDIGLFRILSESGIAAGVRRIEAVTGAGALDWVERQIGALQSAATLARSNPEELPQRVQQMLERARQMEKELDALKAQRAGEAGDSLLSQAVEIDGLKVLAARMDDLDSKALRDALDRLRDKLGSAAIVLASVEDGKVRLVAGVSKDQTHRVKAGELINSVATQVGGKGGGRPDMAQAGGTDPAALDGALASVTDWVRAKLSV